MQKNREKKKENRIRRYIKPTSRTCKVEDVFKKRKKAMKEMRTKEVQILLSEVMLSALTNRWITLAGEATNLCKITL